MTFEELQQSLNEARRHPKKTGWDIYHYMKENLDAMESREARTLLACYMKMTLKRPSLLHSLMLQLALKMAKKYADFQFDKFFEMWEYPGIERILGYVDFYDEKHRHYHIYDSRSRHFVAIDPHIEPQVHEFVEFTPIIPEDGKFKTAVIHSVLGTEYDTQDELATKRPAAYETELSAPTKTGVGSFFYDAVVTRVFPERGYFEYRITSEIPKLDEGFMTDIGSGFMGDRKLEVGQSVRLLILLKREKDGVKRNYVAHVCANDTQV